MGNLTEDQISELHGAFLMFDPGLKGYITVDVLRNLLRCLGYNPEDEEFQILQLTVDRDRTGMIEFVEFIELIELINENSNVEQETLDAFRAFDVDDRGYIASDDVKDALMQVMEKK